MQYVFHNVSYHVNINQLFHRRPLSNTKNSTPYITKSHTRSVAAESLLFIYPPIDIVCGR